MIRLLLVLALVLTAWGKAPVHVKPHVTKQGKVVQGHFRTAPDHTRLNNWSTKGNVNPMTGEVRDQVPSAWTQVEGTEVQALEGTPCQEGGTMIRLLWLLALLEALALLSVKPIGHAQTPGTLPLQSESDGMPARARYLTNGLQNCRWWVDQGMVTKLGYMIGLTEGALIEIASMYRKRYT